MDGPNGKQREAIDGRSTSSAPLTAPPPDSRIDAAQLGILKRFVGAVLTVYWLTLFAATHIPLADAPVQFRGADKVVHFVGYGVLGLLATSWVALRRPLTSKVALLAVSCLAAYGAIDELLQIPVGRTCDIADWACDLFGAGVGVLVIASLTCLHPRLRPRTERADD